MSAWSLATRKKLTASNRQASKGDVDLLAQRLEPDKVPIWNVARFVRLIKIEKIGNRDLRLTLQNDSKKIINGFQIGVGEVGIHTEFLYNEDQKVPPGGVWIEQVPIEPYTDTKGITLLSVHFDDGTSDGDEAAIKQVEEQRAGELTQIRRALPLIRRALRAPGSDSLDGLEGLLSEIRSLPTEGKNGRDDFWAGLESGKKRMIAIITDIRQRADPSTNWSKANRQLETYISTELRRVVENHERILSPH